MNSQFEEARVAWRVGGGVVNGYGPEYDNLVKVCKRYKMKISEVVPLLLSAVESYFAFCKQRKADNVFCEPPSSFTVYTNNRRWLREYPTSKYKTDPKKKAQSWREEQRAIYSKSPWFNELDVNGLREFMGKRPDLVWLVKELRPEIEEQG